MSEPVLYPHHSLDDSGITEFSERDKPAVYVIWRQRRQGDSPQASAPEAATRTYLIVNHTTEEVLAPTLVREMAKCPSEETWYYWATVADGLMADALHRHYYTMLQPLLGYPQP